MYLLDEFEDPCVLINKCVLRAREIRTCNGYVHWKRLGR